MAGTWSVGTGRARRDERREAIVDGALQLFVERGALPVRVEDIAKKVSISRTTFYKYFAERDDILAELFRRLLAIPPPGPGADGRGVERLVGLLAGTAARMIEHEQLARFVYSLPLRHDVLLGGEQAARPAFLGAVHVDQQQPAGGEEGDIADQAQPQPGDDDVVEGDAAGGDVAVLHNRGELGDADGHEAQRQPQRASAAGDRLDSRRLARRGPGSRPRCPADEVGQPVGHLRRGHHAGGGTRVHACKVTRG
jgi:AcrR family transcriptional regulator